MWTCGERTYGSRLIFGITPELDNTIITEMIQASGAELVEVAIPDHDRHAPAWWAERQEEGITLLPATRGCHSVKEALLAANRARSLLGDAWVKLDITSADDDGHPDTAMLIKAAALLTNDGFEVWAVTNHDPVAARRLLEAGCRALYIQGYPINAGLSALREERRDIAWIMTDQLTLPSSATRAMELGFDAIVTGQTCARARDPVAMAEAFADAVAAGRTAYETGIPAGLRGETGTPLPLPFWHQETA